MRRKRYNGSPIQKSLFFTNPTQALVICCIEGRTGLSVRGGVGDFPRLLFKGKRRKIEPKEIRSRLMPRLLVVFTWQLEILVTNLEKR